MDLDLHHKQGEAFLSSATEILYGGAAGGGKSHLMRIAAIYWCAVIPNLQVYLFRRVSDDLAKNHMEGPSGFPVLLADLLTGKQVKIRYTPTQIEFWNGAKIHLCHCQYEKDVVKYQGAEIHVLMIDELTHFTQTQYRFLRGRVRLGGLEIPEKYLGQFPRIVCGSNPGGVGHTWVKGMFIDVAPAMAITEMGREEGGMRRQYIPARLEDNPTLTDSDPDYVLRLEGLGNAALVRAMRDGDWDIVAGGAVDDLWAQQVHVLPPFSIPGSWTVDRSFDWGSSRPFSVGWWAESDGTEAVLPGGTRRTWPRGTLFRVAEFYGWNGRANEGCRMIATEIARRIKEAEKTFPFQVRPGPADASIYDAENGVCIADDMARAGVGWVKADKSPGSRINGLERLRRYLAAALKTPMEEPGLFVFDTCRHFIRTVPCLPRDERRPDDIDSAAEDHIYDETRYRLLAVRQRSTSTEFRL